MDTRALFFWRPEFTLAIILLSHQPKKGTIYQEEGRTPIPFKSLLVKSDFTTFFPHIFCPSRVKCVAIIALEMVISELGPGLLRNPFPSIENVSFEPLLFYSKSLKRLRAMRSFGVIQTPFLTSSHCFFDPNFLIECDEDLRQILETPGQIQQSFMHLVIDQICERWEWLVASLFSYRGKILRPSFPQKYHARHHEPWMECHHSYHINKVGGKRNLSNSSP